MLKNTNYLGKHDSFQQHYGINIIEQSDKNISALKARLTDRTDMNSKMLSDAEKRFFDFWMSTIAPLFTAKHGTTQLKKIARAGALVSVADRRRGLGAHKNSRTGGQARQEFNYFVLGIGENHPVPVSVMV